MRVNILFIVGIIISVTVFLLVMESRKHKQISRRPNTVHVVLIGASIGQGWHIAEWPARTKINGFTAESIPAWQFDKSEVLDEVLMRPARKFHPTRTYLKSLFQAPPREPNIVILKECSSYFPGDLSIYERSIENWVARLETKQIKVILATVVPVTRGRAEQSAGKQESLLRYNEWVRQYTQQHGIMLLDLESALRTDDAGHYLREEYATSDGSHLNSSAYAVLDNFLHKTLCGASDPCVTGSSRLAIAR